MEDMERVVAQVKARFGSLDGVVHAAGVSVPKLILESTRDNTDAVFQAKVRGAVILETLLASEPLDFFIYFSSIASVDPTRGQFDYTAANAMLDALSRRHVSPHWKQVCSISWDAWQEVGMAAEDARKRAMDVVPDLANGPVGAEVQHPVWQYQLKEKNRVLFAGVIRPSQHWIADEHRNGAVAILPGTGILELIYGAHRLVSNSGSAVTIRNVAFRRFVEVPEEGLVAWLFLTTNGNETAFELRSCLPGLGDQRPEDMILHATGSLLPLNEPAALVKQPEGEFEAVPVPKHNIIQFGPRWMTINQEVGGDHGYVRKFSLAKDFASETEEYGLHPALLDRAIGFLSSKQLNRKGIPSLISEIRIFKSLPASVTVIAKPVPGIEGSSSLVMMNDSGEVIMEVDEYQQVLLSEAPPANQLEDLRLGLGEVGDLNTLELVPFELPPPGEGEVQVEVYAAGLNFRDVLTCLGGLSDVEPEGAPPGGECSGRVVAVGPGVERFSVGDAVITVARGAFSTRLNADVRIVVSKPENLSFEEAASIPITYLTAEYALNYLGRIRQGERVLIHAGAGGVGLAAIQIAQAAGADVYATAGSEEKRAYLRDLGVKYVSDSRSLDFAEDICRETNGEGVDLVLNSLAGEFIQASLELLKPYGRFLEIGKRDIYQNSPMGLFPFRNNLSFYGIDLSPMIKEMHPVLIKMFADVVETFSQRKLNPGPVLSVPWAETQRAMEHMAAARHIGKVVLEVCAPARRAKGQISAEEIFKRRYAKSISMENGLDVFQEILLGVDVPPHVIVSPRLSEGKVARPQAPTLLDRTGAGRKRSGTAAYKAPSTPVEESVVKVWQEVFSADSIGVDDDFLELGGDSISSIQILNRIRKTLGAKLPNDALFRFSTPAQLSVGIENTIKSQVD
jgi:NADPH:quinone reductase-like Zn-dependent oxidoreductase/acyl carrier protein